MGFGYNPRFGMDRLRLLDKRIAELSLLVPASQAATLEKLAWSRGLTVGQLLRLLIQEYLAALEENDEGDSFFSGS
jgi:hypothetical protein